MPDVRVRPIRPLDRHAVRLVFGRLSPQARYARWLGVHRTLAEAEVDGLVEADGWHHHGVMAWAPRQHLPLGFASCARTSSFEIAEIAVVVADAMQRRGAGWEMVRALRGSARASGIDAMVATTLVGNAGAWALLERLGVVRVTNRDGGVLECLVTLSPD